MPIPTPTPTPTPEPGTVGGFDEFMAVAEGASVGERQSLVNRYLAQVLSSPISAGARVIFLWQGEAQSVQLVGDMNNWGADGDLPLRRLEGSDLWYLEAEYEPDARLDYRFAINGEDWRLDPLNPRTMMSRQGPNSEVVMPEYETPPELLPSEEDFPSGTLTSHTLNSTYLNHTRTFFVYLPGSVIVGQKLPSVYINNGSDFLNLIDAPAILDQLIAKRLIPPLVAVFVPPISANAEYSLNDDYANFLADELVPFVSESYGTDPDPSKTVILGTSLGGLAAVHAAISRPDVFGLAAGHSGAYAANDDALSNMLTASSGVAPIVQPRSDQTRLYLVVGTYETTVGADNQLGDVLAANRRLADLLGRLGYDYRYEERPEGHSWGLWQATLGRALNYLLSNGP